MNPFELNVLSPKRTVCEKIMRLVRFSYSENPINDLNNKVRHIYDIHILLKDKFINNFFNSKIFEVMLQKVCNDDLFSFKSNNEWLKLHPKSALIFDKPEFTGVQLRNWFMENYLLKVRHGKQ